jgi:hypothetical protein
MSGHILDDDDEAVYAHAFMLADVVRRFLERRGIGQWLDLVAMNDAIVEELRASSAEMGRLRKQRLENARTGVEADR